MSAREDARRAWREAVNAAAREWGGQCRHFRDKPIGWCKRWSAIGRLIFRGMGVDSRLYHDPLGRLDYALAAPKPWRSSQRPDPRRRYSRAHRRGCIGCRRMGQWLRAAGLVARLRSYKCAENSGYIARFERFARDPHGRRP